MPPIQTQPPNPLVYRRRPTREVQVGSVGIGGENPIRLQSMTTTLTSDVKGTVDQALRLAQAGCEIIRVTVPHAANAAHLEKIKSELLKKGCGLPLVADIHFRPDAALQAARIVEKVRINPGNFADSKAFRVRSYTEAEYRDELRRIEDAFTPLVLELKKYKRALRIGANHGSLSDRILSRYGGTPLGMVESALEFLRVCVKNEFHDVVFSMKASSPKVTIHAYRLLARRLDEDGLPYPFHLGVTEAGEGVDGRLKSAVGIGSLLEDGIGDTIRVSLTEEPEKEIPVARELAARAADLKKHQDAINREHIENRRPGGARRSGVGTYAADPFRFSRRKTNAVQSGSLPLGGDAPIRVLSRFVLGKASLDDAWKEWDGLLAREPRPEIVEVPYQAKTFSQMEAALKRRKERWAGSVSFWISFEKGSVPESISRAGEGFIYRFGNAPDPKEAARLAEAAEAERAVLVLCGSAAGPVAEMSASLYKKSLSVAAGIMGEGYLWSVYAARRLAAELNRLQIMVPIVLFGPEPAPGLLTAEVFGGLLSDGIGDAVSVSSGPGTSETVRFAFDFLQAAGSRITKAEFISCPSCGRTLFDLPSATERLKRKTGHLKGVKIAVMGCIVNGPGEMADADFGYVGGGPGKISLYRGQTCVEKSVPVEEADGKLIELIKKEGKWTDPLSPEPKTAFLADRGIPC